MWRKATASSVQKSRLYQMQGSGPHGCPLATTRLLEVSGCRPECWAQGPSRDEGLLSKSGPAGKGLQGAEGIPELRLALLAEPGLPWTRLEDPRDEAVALPSDPPTVPMSSQLVRCCAGARGGEGPAPIDHHALHWGPRQPRYSLHWTGGSAHSGQVTSCHGWQQGAPYPCLPAGPTAACRGPGLSLEHRGEDKSPRGAQGLVRRRHQADKGDKFPGSAFSPSTPLVTASRGPGEGTPS